MVTGSHSVVKLTVLVQWEVSLSEHFHRVSGSGSEVVKSEGVVDNGSVVAVVVNNPGLFFAAGSPAEGSAMSCYAVSIHRQSGRSGTGGKGGERGRSYTPFGTVGP